MRKILAALILLLTAAQVYAVGNVVSLNTRPTTKIVKYTLTWTSTAGGMVSANPVSIKGYLFQYEIVPANGANQPTNLYGVTLLDAQGADFLLGNGASLNNVNAKLGSFNPPLFVDGMLDVNVTAAGASKRGQVVLFLEVE